MRPELKFSLYRQVILLITLIIVLGLFAENFNYTEARTIITMFLAQLSVEGYQLRRQLARADHADKDDE